MQTGRMTDDRYILIIDDDADFADGLADVISLLGFTPRTAASGEEGLELAKTTHFDFAFVDIGLPNINGVECARALITDQHSIKCALVTGYGADYLRKLDVESVDAPILTKPVSIDQISAVLDA